MKLLEIFATFIACCGRNWVVSESQSDAWLQALPSTDVNNLLGNNTLSLAAGVNQGFKLNELCHCTCACAANEIPHIPGDNSHYVEGESRYIWMPDGDGMPHLVDLHERPSDEALLEATGNGANNEYWLFTRNNPNYAQVLVYGDADSIWTSNYLGGRPLKVIVHGWYSNANCYINPMITAAFLAVQDCNVIVVDWSSVANAIYWVAASGVPGAGQHIGQFLTWLIDTAGGSWDDVHIVGFSLGAHVVGNAGRAVQNRVARITGLDPAGPFWRGNSNALRASDGQYVEVIHTDGGGLGIFDPIGGSNFYPNGGRNPQPGCFIYMCSHRRVCELFTSSIYTNHFNARLCESLDDARNKRCTGDRWLQMGNANADKRGTGIYGLSTGDRWPF